LTSYSCFQHGYLEEFLDIPGFQTKVLAKFVDMICTFFYTHSPYFMCHCTEYKLSALQVTISEKNKLSAATQEFITAKFWLRVEKGRKTHSSLRQSNLQLQSEAALMCRRIRTVEHRCAAEHAGAYPDLQDRNLLNYTTGLPTCPPKNPDLVPEKPDNSFEAYTHKTCTTTHKINIKTGQKHRHNTSQIFRSIFLPRSYTVVHLFFYQ